MFDAPITDLQCGSQHCCMLLASGNMSCWGYNNYGQLGDGTVTVRNQPVAVIGLIGAIASMSVGYQHSCAVAFDGELYCWVRRVLVCVGARITNELDSRDPAAGACAT
jgi:alpha-tubulin suppressor-like RCC1 family protein